ncbi:hypothetical protein AU210_005392 [Fusarium oxysporum f. sp. radicis-cucumerinum]|uniref:Cofilin n=1 Tax=Fusarium oxysporum f. sp. radicis-cucumerinum TaxID=327505 RepID=A0A2H3HR07_FUSOX|nr:hypothetical protein AU210_005392 [Fusarium oxysporum f. sp. radicis-cucumerinum]
MPFQCFIHYLLPIPRYRPTVYLFSFTTASFQPTNCAKLLATHKSGSYVDSFRVRNITLSIKVINLQADTRVILLKTNAEKPSVQIQDECISAVNELRSRRDADKPRYVIYKISDNGQNVVVDETSSDKNYEAFLNKLASATDDKGKPAPRYAAYDVEYDLGEEGKR